MERKHQVFVSSTYKDLVDERKEVIHALLELDCIPAGMELSLSYLHEQLKRRKLGYGRGARQKIEDDSVEIYSGVRHGLTMGGPIALLLENKDWK